MNDKILGMACLFFFVMIGINGFLLYAAQLQDPEGNTMNLFYGMSTSGLSGDVTTTANTITVDPGTSDSSTAPANEQGFPIINVNSKPAGLSAPDQFVIMVAGTQLVMGKFSEMYPPMAPIFNILIFVATALQVFVAIYLGSVLARALVARVS